VVELSQQEVCGHNVVVSPTSGFSQATAAAPFATSPKSLSPQQKRRRCAGGNAARNGGDDIGDYK
jgi:hypothetical protein